VVRYFQSISLSKSSLNNQIFSFEITLHPRTCSFIVSPLFKIPASPCVWCHVTTPIFQNHMHYAVYYSSNLEETQHPTRPISFLFAKTSVLCDIYGNNNICSSVQVKLSVVTFTSILEILLWTIICKGFAFRFTYMILHIFPVSKIVTTVIIIKIIIMSQSS